MLPTIYLARHGETAWSLTGQHTGLTNLPLTVLGVEDSKRLGARLQTMSFAKVYTSPLLRASQTCALAGYGAIAEIDPDLVEWDYGEYEGRRTIDIHEERPGWNLFRDGCPGGEMPEQVGSRADRFLKRAHAVGGDVLVFSSSHFMRVLAARWLGLSPLVGKYLLLNTTSLSALGYENDADVVLRFWNDTSHLRR